MSLFLRLALRNIFRNRIRTYIALLAIAAGCAALIVNGGVVFNIFRELREDAIHGRQGHLQIYKRGYSDAHLEDPQRYLLEPEQAQKILAIVRADPRVLRATSRREFSGLISKGDRYVPFLGVAVEPEQDTEFSRHTTLRAGEALSASNPYGALAGLGLARKLDGKPGDEATLMTTTESGALNAVHVRLQGVFEGGLKEYDDWTLKVPLGAVEHLLLDNHVEQIVLLLRNTEEVPAVRAQLEAAFRREGLDVEMRSWDQLALFHNQVVGLFGRELSILRLIIGTIVVLGIGNAIGMSIMERTVELATLRTLGLRVRAIVALLLTESLLTGMMGATLGLALGIAVARVASAIGIPYPSPPGSTRPFIGGVDVVPAIVATAFVISIAATLAAAIFPIWKAMRRPIAPALRHG
jgi:putative ABC transport system permease protein